MGEIVLNSELRSTKNILMLLLSRSGKIVLRAFHMATSVDLLVFTYWFSPGYMQVFGVYPLIFQSALRTPTSKSPLMPTQGRHMVGWWYCITPNFTR